MYHNAERISEEYVFAYVQKWDSTDGAGLSIKKTHITPSIFYIFTFSPTSRTQKNRPLRGLNSVNPTSKAAHDFS